MNWKTDWKRGGEGFLPKKFNSISSPGWSYILTLLHVPHFTHTHTTNISLHIYTYNKHIIAMCIDNWNINIQKNTQNQSLPASRTSSSCPARTWEHFPVSALHTSNQGGENPWGIFLGEENSQVLYIYHVYVFWYRYCMCMYTYIYIYAYISGYYV